MKNIILNYYFNFINFIKNKSVYELIFYIILSVVIIVNIFIRFSLWLRQVPFSYDEELLGVFFFKTNYTGLFNSLHYLVKIPPIWGILNQAALNIFGHTFLIYRLVSFISGLITIPLFIILCKDIFKNKIAFLSAIIFFIYNPTLLFYSVNFRPYSFDLLISLILILLYKHISLKEISLKQTIIFSVCAFIMQISSFSVMIILPSVIFAKSIQEKYFNRKCLLILFALLSACIYLYLIDKNCYDFMLLGWKYSFWDLSVKSLFDLFNNLFKFIFIYPNDYPNNLNYLTFIFLIGFIYLLKDNFKYGLLFLFFILLNLFTSLVKVYPLGDRVCLYLFPVIFISLCKIIDIQLPLFEKVKNLGFIKHNKIILLILSLILSYTLFSVSYINKWSIKFINPFDTLLFENERKEYYDFSKTFLNKYKEGEKITAYIYLMVNLDFYNNYFNLNKKLEYTGAYIFIKENDNMLWEVNIDNLKKALKEKKESKVKYWIILSTNALEVNPDNVNIIENELKKEKIKYNKNSNEYIHMFEIL